MVVGSTLVQQVRTRLLRQKQLNLIGFFFSLAVSSWIFSHLILKVFSFLPLLSVLPPALCGVFLGLALWKVHSTIDLQTSAALIDGKIDGKDRFLTLTSVLPETKEETFYVVLQQQADQLSASFRIAKALPFSFERRMLSAFGFALLSVLLFFLFPHFKGLYPSLPVLSQSGSHNQWQDNVQVEDIEALKGVAYRLLHETASPQEQVLGTQLVALVQQLQDPSLSQPEKKRLIEETRKRLNLDLPLPQMLPFDLKIFASKSKEGKGEGNKDNLSQGDNSSSSNSDPSRGQTKGSTTTGNELQHNTEQDGEQKKQSQPRQAGGGITFNFPQPQTQNQERSSQESSEAGQQPSQVQANDSLAPGADPTRLGGSQDKQRQNQRDLNAGGAGEGQNQQSAEGANVGQGKGQRSLKPGEQPGDGFLTEDARFVKVRVPLGQEALAAEEARMENNNRATPRTPYSNAPLKEADPEHTQVKQPIPLEYRSILKE